MKEASCKISYIVWSHLYEKFWTGKSLGTESRYVVAYSCREGRGWTVTKEWEVSFWHDVLKLDCSDNCTTCLIPCWENRIYQMGVLSIFCPQTHTVDGKCTSNDLCCGHFLPKSNLFIYFPGPIFNHLLGASHWVNPLFGISLFFLSVEYYKSAF